MWQYYITQASQQWIWYIALVQPFEQKIIQLHKVKPFVDKVLAAHVKTEGDGLNQRKTAYFLQHIVFSH